MPNRFCFGNIQYLKKLRMHSRFAATDLYHIGFAFVADNQIEHRFYFFQCPMPPVVWRRFGVTGRTCQVATVGHFNNRYAGMLLVVSTQTAIVRAAIMRFCAETARHFAAFDIISRVFIVFYIGCEQHFFVAVFGAAFEHPHFAVFKNDFCVHAAEAF